MTATSLANPRRFRIPPVGLVSAALVVAGLVLGATVNMAFWILFAAGVFGPPLLRELGVLADRDEFQRAASVRAGHRAYITGGLLLTAVTIAKEWGETNIDHDLFPASVGMAAMVVVYFMSYVGSYWGAPRAAFRVLIAFGTVWLVFVVLSHGASPIELLAELPVALPFFILAFLARRWPRATGAATLALAVFACYFLRLGRALQGNTGSAMVFITLALPLAVTGVELLRHRSESGDAA